MNKDPNFQMSMFSGPIPGEGLTHPPKGQPWQQPPQHTKLEDTMTFLMHQLTEPEHLKQLLGLMEGGMSIEAITRTILFAGFTQGKWTPDLGLLMYKPLMLSLTAIAHRAGLKDTPMVMKESLQKHAFDKLKSRFLFNHMSGNAIKNTQGAKLPEVPKDNVVKQTGGFFKRGK